ncbi:PLP-dependent transferase [Thozetella sp. PMI_491]|nr:PLP-dependent transferase [Thozetella sp. PMI_491]
MHSESLRDGTPIILESYPEYASTSRLDELRDAEYAYLDDQDHLYLDYTGSGLAAHAQHRAHTERLSTTLFGNPHSISPTSDAATKAVAQARQRVLQHLSASADEYTVVFTANATGAARLVGEAYPFRRGSRLVLTTDNHNSVNGLREFARRRHARTTYVAASGSDLRVDQHDLLKALSSGAGRSLLSLRAKAASALGGHGRSGLFAYPAQSNFSGVRHPLEWVRLAQDRGFHVLLDAAAYLPTATLDLSGPIKPDFITISWYKLFGYPTGLGCLVVRRDALACLRRPWFSGGTIQVVTVQLPKWHVMADDEAAFEDGTLNFLAIPDIVVGLNWLESIGMSLVETRVRCLTGWFLDSLLRLRHSSGRAMVVVYGPKDMRMRGATVTFNFFDAAGKVVDERLVAVEASRARISLRTGCFCNPGCGEDAFGLRTSSLEPLLRAGVKFIDDYLRVVGLPSAGAIRVSFGIASNAQDVSRFLDWAENTYKDRITNNRDLPPRGHC